MENGSFLDLAKVADSLAHGERIVGDFRVSAGVHRAGIETLSQTVETRIREKNRLRPKSFAEHRKEIQRMPWSRV